MGKEIKETWILKIGNFQSVEVEARNTKRHRILFLERSDGSGKGTSLYFEPEEIMKLGKFLVECANKIYKDEDFS